MVPVMKTRTTQEWIALFEDKAVPCGPINTIADAFDDVQVKSRGLRVELPRWENAAVQDGVSQIPGVANPIRMSGTPVSYRNAAPALGQHTDEVLHEMGLSAEAIAALRDGKVV